jgi:hypothetical protein
MKDWREGCDMGFYVGQKVVTQFGDGVVDLIDDETHYPIVVSIEGVGVVNYTRSGCRYLHDKLPTCYPIELTPKFYQPEWQPKEGEWCWFWDEFNTPTIRRFKRIARSEVGEYPYMDELYMCWPNCAPYDGNMTPPWERGEEK